MLPTLEVRANWAILSLVSGGLLGGFGLRVPKKQAIL
jgi:hypothetical protein